jgi:hypothetical protein
LEQLRTGPGCSKALWATLNCAKRTAARGDGHHLAVVLRADRVGHARWNVEVGDLWRRIGIR